MLSKSSSIIQAEAELKLSAGQLPFREWHSHNPQCNPHPHLLAESNHVVDKFHKSCHRWLSKGGFKQNHSSNNGNGATITFDSGEKQFSFFLCCVTLGQRASSQASLFGSFGSLGGRASYLWHLHIFCITQSMASTWKICLPYCGYRSLLPSVSLSLSPCAAVSVCWPLSGILVLFALNSADTKRICIASSGRCA